MPRIRFLSVLAVVSGGLVCWSLLPQSSSGQNRISGQPENAEPATPQIAGTTPKKAIAIPAPPPHRAEGDFDLYEPDKSEHKIYEALTKPVEIEFIDTPLKDAMDFIAEAHKITIIIDEQALTEEGDCDR